MKIRQQITEDEVIARFLQGEIDSPRYGRDCLSAIQHLNIDPSIIRSPNICSSLDNHSRKTLLNIYRKDYLPYGAKWYMATLEPEDFQKIKCANTHLWAIFTKNSRLLTAAAQTISSGVVPNEQYSDIPIFFQNIVEAAAAVRNGIRFPIPPMLVSINTNADYVIFEGHCRLTAYALNPHSISSGLEVIIGFIDNWSLY